MLKIQLMSRWRKMWWVIRDKRDVDSNLCGVLQNSIPSVKSYNTQNLLMIITKIIQIICAWLCAYAWVPAHKWVCMCVCECVCVYARVCVYVCECTWRCASVYMWVYVYLRLCACGCMCVWMLRWGGWNDWVCWKSNRIHFYILFIPYCLLETIKIYVSFCLQKKIIVINQLICQNLINVTLKRCLGNSMCIIL